MSFRIPDQHKAGLTSILRLQQSQVRHLTALLDQLAPALKLRDLTERISPAVPEIDSAELSRILKTLYSLYQVRASSEATLDEFVSDLLGTIQEEPELQPLGIDPAGFKEILSTLLGVVSLATYAKAFALQRDYEHIYHDAKILTDIRPVFGSDVTEDPVGVVLTHTLKIVFHDAAAHHNEIYLSLDEKDILKLREVLERAQSKARTLGTLTTQHNIRNLDF